MKKDLFVKLARTALIIVALMAVVSAVFGYDVSTVGGVITAGVIPGTITTSEVKSVSGDLLLEQIEKKIVEVEPDRAPLDTLLRHIPDRGKANSIKVPYYKVDYKGVEDTVHTAVTASGQTLFNLKVNKISMWADTDTVAISGNKAYDEDNNEIALQDFMCYVVGVDRGESILRLQPINGYVSGGVSTLKSGNNIAQAAKIYRCGRAGQEEDIQTTPYVDMPVKDYNYCQKFMAQIEESTWSKIHAKEVDWAWDDYTRRQIGNMRIDKEMSYIKGARRMINHINNSKPVYLTGGATQFIAGLTDLQSVTFNNAMFQKLTREIFEGNNGSDQRILLTGNLLMQKLGEIDDVTKQVNAKSRETEFGLTFNRINTNFGELLVIRHPLFYQMGMSHMGLCMDLPNVSERFFEPLRTENLDLKAAGQKDVQSKVLIETACPLFRNVSTHRWIKGPTS